jgi:DNA-binding protein HU-beta
MTPRLSLIWATSSKGFLLTKIKSARCELQIPGFGKFSVRKRAARKGRNPRTGQTIQIRASKSVGFKPAAAFKGSL